MTTRNGLSPSAMRYVLAVSAAGLTVVGYSCVAVASAELDYRWTLLAALTVLSGSATVRLPSVPATISISETFVFTAVLLYGPDVGAVIVALDGLIISCWFKRRRRELHRIAFNVAAPALSVWTSAQLYFAFPGIGALSVQAVELSQILLPLAFFTVSHFVLNSSLIAVAVATETQRRAFDIWRHDFLWLSLNYFGGASVAVLLVVYTRQVDLSYLSLIIPLLLILYFTFKIPMARVEDTNNHLVHMNQLYLSTIETLAMAIDAKDQVTHGHIRRVQLYAVGLAKALGINDTGLLRAIEASALLHDMGKLAIPEYILNKPGRLSEAEFERMKLHASIGADILSAIEFPYPVVPIVRHHHENWDGSGYPSGLKHIEIPVGARILSVVDCYDALTSDRPYRPSLTHAAARDILLSRRGSMYDPLVVDTFLEVYPSLALLSEKTDEPLPAVARVRSVRSGTHRSLTSGTTASSAMTATRQEESRLSRLQQVLCGLAGDGTLIFAKYDPPADRLVIIFADGIDSPVLGQHFELGQQTIGWVAATRRSAENADALLDFRRGTSLALDRARYCCAVPLAKGGNELVGVLALYCAEPLTPAVIRLAQAICKSATPWLHNELEPDLRDSTMVLAEVVGAIEGPIVLQGRLPIHIAGFLSGTTRLDLQQVVPHLLPGDLVSIIDESLLIAVRVGGPGFSGSATTCLRSVGIATSLGTLGPDCPRVQDFLSDIRTDASRMSRIA